MNTVNGFTIKPAPGGWALVRSSGAAMAVCQTRESAESLAQRFIPEDENGRPLERYVPASWWRRLFNPGALGRWVKT